MFIKFQTKLKVNNQNLKTIVAFIVIFPNIGKQQKSIQMKILGNLIWLVFGGFAIFMEYMVAGLLLCITVIGIPFGLQSFKLGILALWPFGQKIEYMDYAPGCLSTIMNILWLFIGGIWIMLTHLLFGILLGITIIGIPWARQHFKMASLALTPFGRRLV